MLDKSIPYKNVYMKIDAPEIEKMQVEILPKGYSYRMFQEYDEHNWARIEASVDEFDSEQAALEYFSAVYLPDLESLKKRCVFVVNPDGLPIATANAWYANSEELGYQATLQWVSTMPEYQGKGIGKAVVTKAMFLFPEVDPGLDVMLHTQTWSYIAIILYHRLGFYVTKTEQVALELKTEKGMEIKLLHNDFDNGAITVLKTVMKPELLEAIVGNAK